MISFFQVFNKGGAVLWSKQLEVTDDKSDDTKAAPDGGSSTGGTTTTSGVPRMSDLTAHNPHKARIDALVQNVLLEERAGQSTFQQNHYALKWTFENGLDLVFVAVYMNLTPLLYIDELLDSVKREFVSLFGAELKTAGALALPKAPAHYEKFSESFQTLLSGYLARELSRAPKVQRKYEATSEKTLEKAGAFAPKKSKKALAAEEKKKKKEEEEAAAAAAAEEEARKKAAEEQAMAAIAPTKALKKPGPSPMMRTGAPKTKKPSATATPTSPPVRVKEQRKWDDSKLTRDEADKLDFSTDKDKNPAKSGELPAAHDATFGATPTADDGDYTAPDVKDGSLLDDDDDDEKSAPAAAAAATAAATAAAAAPAKVGMLRGLFNTIVGKKVLAKEDLQPVLETFRQTLIGKNVAAEIAEKLCDSVGVSLAGKTLPSFTTVYRIVRKDVEAALTRILTPKRPLDLLQGAMAARDAKRPYTIVFVGVNGVGKSTTLSKVAAYFQSKAFKVGIAACDTFRAGAVEQLKTHCMKLKIPLFDRGYLKEAHLVAQDSIAAAKRDGTEVLLIDTAGRMQDNAPLMQALSKLIALNKPDTVLFVGEALVGNDAVDQVTKFNRCLADLDESSVPRLIDGLVLTKFDTIDDKVGAAISLTYATGQPIVFVGTGQTYKDLKRMNVETLIKALLK